MFKRKKKTLTREQEDFFFNSGEKYADRIKLKEKINRINNFGNEKPKTMFIIIFATLILFFSLSFLFPFSKRNQKIDQIEIVNIANSSKDFEMEKIKKLYIEVDLTTDTILSLLKRGNLSSNDSSFIVKKYIRLEQLKKTLNLDLKEE